jgi:hypothetical protein
MAHANGIPETIARTFAWLYSCGDPAEVGENSTLAVDF